MKDTRTITIPETPEELREQRMPKGAVVDFDFSRFVRYLLDECQEFNRDAKSIKAALRIEDAIGSNPIVLREEDWKVLSQVAQSPGVPYPTKPARLCMPYLEAIEDAKREE